MFPKSNLWLDQKEGTTLATMGIVKASGESTSARENITSFLKLEAKADGYSSLCSWRKQNLNAHIKPLTQSG